MVHKNLAKPDKHFTQNYQTFIYSRTKMTNKSLHFLTCKISDKHCEYVHKKYFACATIISLWCVWNCGQIRQGRGTPMTDISGELPHNNNRELEYMVFVMF